jgi:hypothetical protein
MDLGIIKEDFIGRKKTRVCSIHNVMLRQINQMESK